MIIFKAIRNIIPLFENFYCFSIVHKDKYKSPVCPATGSCANLKSCPFTAICYLIVIDTSLWLWMWMVPPRVVLWIRGYSILYGFSLESKTSKLPDWEPFTTLPSAFRPILPQFISFFRSSSSKKKTFPDHHTSNPKQAVLVFLIILIISCL